MYFALTEAMKRRFVLEMRRFWASHPKYRDIVDHIQGKYSFRERPQYGIIVKTSGGNRVDLSADNYIGVINAYPYLAKVGAYAGLSVEWVREDSLAIQKNGGLFPSLPGVYFMEITGANEFYVDPLLDVYAEPVTMVDTITGQLQNAPLTGTLRLFEMPAAYQLVEGTNYTLTLDPAGKPTGEIILAQALTGGRTLTADYRHAAASTGPHEFHPMFANNTAIPGVVLAFGERSEVGDRLAVVIQDMRRPACLAYGGQWELTLDFEVMSRDVYAQQQIADMTVIYLWGVLRAAMSSEGLEMTELSLGGESEEIYDDNADDYFYNSTFSLTVRTNWEIYVPLNIFLRQASFMTLEQSQAVAAMTDDQVASFNNNLRMVENLGLQRFGDPFFSDRSYTYEVIR
jgi:hypothetical protein